MEQIIPTGWKIKKLSEISEISAGNSAPQKEVFFENGIYPFFRTSDVGNIHFGSIQTSHDYLNDEGIKGLKLFRKGTILFPKSGASTFLNHRVKMERDGYVVSHLATIKANNDELLDEYLLYYLSTVDSKSLIQDGNYPSLNLPIIGDIQIYYPSLPEQERIVKKLDDIIYKIDCIKADTQTAFASTKDLFEGIINEVLVKRFINLQPKKISEISENCDAKRIPITKNLRTTGKYPYYGASGIVDYVDNYIFDGNYLLVSEDGANLLMRTYPIAFSISGKSWINNHAHILQFKQNCTQKFVEYYLNHIKLDNYITGAAQPKLTQNKLNNIQIKLPSDEEQESIISLLEKQKKIINLLEKNYQQKLILLDELKQSILNKAFKGEL